ncbi:MAG: exodeoxyribonuclease VII small subunit [Thermoplasmata archaeon]|nr:exodeoxyribonuclease VII small subunit [Candidatus Thermoplasmatota archaeon]MCK4948628.1 exodeoxyribonuclease VII small subunit [Thermoplasmata archaeon]
MTFEDALERLENIVDTLSKGKLSLDEGMERFEEGIRLFRLCDEKLRSAEQRVSVLTQSQEGVEERPYDE